MPAASVTVNAAFKTPWAALQQRFNDASADKDDPTVITLTENVTALDTDSALEIPVDKYVVLDLNGFAIDRGLTEAKDGGNVITVNGTLTVTDGTITGGKNSGNGGGVYVAEGGAFTMNDSTISGNSSVGGDGGGVYVAEGGAFTMNDSSITSNSIGDGSPELEAFGGGGVCNYGTFTMNGGEITDNSASEYGHFFGTGVSNAGTFIVSGDARVVYNRIGESENGDVYLPYGKVITVNGALGEKAVFNVKVEALSEDGYVTITSGLSQNSLKHFKAEWGYTVGLVDGEAAIGWSHTVSVAPVVNGVATVDKARAIPGEAITVTVTPEEGYLTGPMSYTVGEGDPVPIDGMSFGMPKGDVTVSPTFITEWEALQKAIDFHTGEYASVRLSDYAGNDGRITCPADGSALDIDKKLTLDLAGCVLDRGLDDSMDDGYVIHVGGNGVLTVIDDNSTATHDPAITYTNPVTKETVTVNGGVITGGNSTGNGGGVYGRGWRVHHEQRHHLRQQQQQRRRRVRGRQWRVHMNSGTICGNNSNSGGGGVYVNLSGAFTMNGGEISGNSSVSNSGAGVYNAGMFSVSGDAQVTGNLKGEAASNVYLDSGTVIHVTGTLADTARFGVSTEASPANASVTVTNGLLGNGALGNFTSDIADYIVLEDNGEAALIGEWAALKNAIDAATGENATVKVSDYAGADRRITCPANGSALDIDKKLTLDLAGCVLDRGLTEATEAGYVIHVGGNGDLTVIDSDDSDSPTEHTYKNPVTGKTETVTGGVITGGNASGINVDNKACSGGVQVSGGAFTLSGGTICGNTGSNGGGVYVAENGSFTLSGGAVTGNTASTAGGGVNVAGNYDTDKGTFNVSGNAQVSGNALTDGTASNVQLYYYNFINVTGALTSGANIGVTIWNDEDDPSMPGYSVFTAGYDYRGDNSANRETLPSAYFHSDAGAYEVGLNTKKKGSETEETTLEAQLVTPWNALDNRLWYQLPDGDGVTHIVLDKDYTADTGDSYLQVPAGQNVELDLNGHTIDRHLTEAQNAGYVISVLGTLTVKDSSTDAEHPYGQGKITGGWNSGD